MRPNDTKGNPFLFRHGAASGRRSVTPRPDLDLSRHEEIRRVIEGGGLIVLPTETVLGLGCNPRDSEAIGRVYRLKGRERSKPLQLFVPTWIAALPFIGESRLANMLADAFLPGPLTIVARATNATPREMLAGGDSVGIRVPAAERLRELLTALPTPLAVTSANPSGEPAVAEIVELDARIEAGVDAIVVADPPLGNGQPSTVVEVSGETVVILREGAVSRGAVEEVVIQAGGQVEAGQ